MLYKKRDAIDGEASNASAMNTNLAHLGTIGRPPR
jgi:hypothetical protein